MDSQQSHFTETFIILAFNLNNLKKLKPYSRSFGSLKKMHYYKISDTMFTFIFIIASAPGRTALIVLNQYRSSLNT